ncbi:hypothetical protein DFH08DRAFT_857591 [Mycena albidolilacea]|uniref:Uncharacterized protein n=1 Tax=Mycena albidolilacea TaxID=1033008 RepID=A0AAD7A989_9AGAR|nr:hypothetical protein DFH08DRAFT_857591 [Mycena albidolilacea]
MTMVQEQEKEKDEGRRERKDSTRRSRRDSTRSERDADEHKERHHHRERDKRKSRGSDDDRERDRDKRSRDKDGHRSSRDRSRDSHREHSRDSRRSARDRDRERDHHSDKEKDEPVAAYTPEFLHALAHSNSPTKPEFDVISGADAVAFARKFVRDQAASGADVPAALSAAAGTSASQSQPHQSYSHAPGHTPSAVSHTSLTHGGTLTASGSTRRALPPVVFAFPRAAAGDAGRRVVDFYMSWRGKTKTTPLKGRSRRAGFLDAEFKRVREVLDGEWKRASRALKGAVCASEDAMAVGPVKLARAPTDPQPPPRLPPMLAQYAREEQDKNKPGEGGFTAPPAARSVSDPFPGASSAYPLPSSFPINTERPPLGTHHRGSVDSLTSVTSLPLLGMVRGVPVGNRVPLRVMNPGDRMSMSSSSGSLAEVPNINIQATRGSPLRDGVSFNVPPSVELQGANANVAPMHALHLPGRTVSDSSASSGGSSKSRKSSKSKSSRKETPLVKDEDKIVIVLLDDNDKDKVKGTTPEKKKVVAPDDDATWHGLERRLSTRSTSKPSPPVSAHNSPWLGPLVDLDEDITYVHTPDDSDYSDSDDDEEDPTSGRRNAGAVVPIKSLLSAMGYLAPEAAVLGGTPSPYGSYASLQTPYNSPYVAPYPSYVSPQLQGSPYQLQLPSRPHTPVGSYGTTPSMGQAQAPPWVSPAVYPPTAYSSPAPAGYASPYAPASPGVGYASPYAATATSPAGYASPYAAASPGLYASRSAGYPSPAGGYGNLAAAYSSPYVSPLQGPRGSPGLYQG